MSDSASCPSEAKREAGNTKGTKTLKAKAKSIKGRLGTRSKKRFIVKTSAVGNRSEILILDLRRNFLGNGLSVGCEEKSPLTLRIASEVFCPKEASSNLLIRKHSKINTILSTNTIKRKITRIRAVLVEERRKIKNYWQGSSRC
ncbi:MAG: hypothetical protein OEZ41_02830 [Nitrospirota bacterium]|nr:hypothetical protein [Nitrospirota bacterium]MDH5698879.1 hypothetical protein [Nitrospirota bacterium]